MPPHPGAIPLPGVSGSTAPSPALRLDVTRERALRHAAQLVADAWRSFDHPREGQPPVGDGTGELLGEELPECPASALEVLDDAARVLDESIAPTRPRYFAFVGSSGLEVAAVADFMAACFDVNLAVDAHAATAIERLAGRWVARFTGYDEDATANFTSGGTVSNITGLMAARERAIPGTRARGMAGVRAAVYTSEDAHHSVVRAAELLGIGAGNVRRIAVDAQRRMRTDLLAAALDSDIREGITPVAVVATAGTTLVGAVDPIAEIADLCAERDVWLHVDGAYGLPAASLATRARLFAGVDRADSATVDAHKWMYLPKACSVVMAKDRGDLLAAFGHESAYMLRDPDGVQAVEGTLEYSRPFRALKYWVAFRAHGAAAFRAALQRNLDQAMLFYTYAQLCPEIETLMEPQLSVVPFRHRPPHITDRDSLNAHNRRLAEALQRDARVWLASAEIDGDVWLRPCFVNFRSSDDDVIALIEISREVGESVR